MAGHFGRGRIQSTRNSRHTVIEAFRKRFERRLREIESEARTALAVQETNPRSALVSSRRAAEARLIISQIVLEAMCGLEMHYPKVSTERRRELKSIRQSL